MINVTTHLVEASNAHLLDRVDLDVFDGEVDPSLLEQFLANPMNHLVVAVVDDKVIGMASAISYVHPDKPPQLFINEVGVAGPYRRRGVGKRLLEHLLRHGEDLGCHEAWVATETSNHAARALYSAVGGKEDDDPAVVYTYALGSRRHDG